MQAENLNQNDVDEMKNLLEELKEDNPEIQYKFWAMDKTDVDKPLRQQVDELAEIVVEMQMLLKKIFGDHVLVNGRFIDIKNLLIFYYLFLYH